MNVDKAFVYSEFYPESRVTVFILFAVFFFIFLIVRLASRFHGGIKLRKIPAMAAIDDAFGRAAETGRPVLYLSGMYDMNSVATIASVNIFAYIAEKAAVYETVIKMPCCRSLVMNAASAAAASGYSKAGKPELYRPENIFYVTDDQWGFACAVDSIITRERPAVSLMFGHFVSESLVYAETASAAGAFQIAATNDFNQIPFLVVACDHCMIGEELYAAAAYLSPEKSDASYLAAIDLCKLIIIMMIIFGTLAVSIKNL